MPPSVAVPRLTAGALLLGLLTAGARPSQAQPAPGWRAHAPLPTSVARFCQDTTALPASPRGLAIARRAWQTATRDSGWPALPAIAIAPRALPPQLGAEASLSARAPGHYVLRTHRATLRRATTLHELVHAALDAAPAAVIRASVDSVRALSAREPALLAHATVGALTSIGTTFGEYDARAHGPLLHFITDGLAYLSAVNDLGHAYRAYQIRDTTVTVPVAPVQVDRVLTWISDATRDPARPLTRALETLAQARRRAGPTAADLSWSAGDEGALIFVSEVLAYALGDRCAASPAAARPVSDATDTAHPLR